MSTYAVWDDDQRPGHRSPTLETNDVQLARLKASTLRKASITKRIRRFCNVDFCNVDFEMWQDGQRWNSRIGDWEWVAL